MSARYQVRLKNQAGEQVALITDESPIFKSFYCTRQKNAPGLCRFEIDGASHEATLFEVDGQIELLRSVPDFGVDWYVEWEGFFVSPDRATLEDGTQTFVAYGATYLDLARREEIGYYAGTAYVAKSGPGETVIKQFVNENIGAGAGSLDRVDDGTMPGLVVQADEGRGSLWEGSRAWKPLLATIQEIAEATGLAFDVIGTGPATFAFTVYDGWRGLDRSVAGLNPATGLNAAGFEPVIFALERDNMLTPSLSVARGDEINVVYVLGQGAEAARQVQVVKNPDSIALSPWNRRVETRNANQETTASALIAVGEAQLQERLAQPSFDFAPLQVEGSSYGEHYSFGDLVTVKYEEVEANVEITGMQLTVNDQGEALRFSFGPLRAVAPGDVRKQQVAALTRIDERVSHLESLDNGPVSTGATILSDLDDVSVTGVAQNDVLVRGAATWNNLNIAASQIVARLATGHVVGATVAQIKTLLTVGREALTAARTYYVRTDGSDSNTGLTNSSGGAFLTWQHAVDVIQNSLDLSGYDVTVQAGNNGTWTGAVVISTGWVGKGTVQFLGDTTTPGNVLFSVTSADAISLDKNARLSISGIKLSTTTSGNCISMISGSHVDIDGNCEFGASAGYHIVITRGARLFVNANYSITGGATNGHYVVLQNAILVCLSRTITLSGTLAFGTFIHVGVLGSSNFLSSTFTGGTITGLRYALLSGGAITGTGGSGTFFPGNVAGTNDGTGIYQ